MGFFSDHHEDDAAPVPGTVHLVDLDGTMRAKHAKGSDVVLVPAPSRDPDDPVGLPPASPKRILTVLNYS